MMKKYLAPWGMALISALAIHLLIFALLDKRHWFELAATDEANSHFEVLLIPATQGGTTTGAALPNTAKQSDLFGLGMTSDVFQANRGKRNTQENQGSVDISQLKKPEWLDIAKIQLSPESNDNALTGVFSPILKAQIAASKAAQKEYLKGQVKETHYPITQDADGTRYVNIKGVCWRMPKEGSKQGWVIVFAGCNGQTKSFHFELNITPSTLLGPGSPFSIGK